MIMESITPKKKIQEVLVMSTNSDRYLLNTPYCCILNSRQISVTLPSKTAGTARKCV